MSATLTLERVGLLMWRWGLTVKPQGRPPHEVKFGYASTERYARWKAERALTIYRRNRDSLRSVTVPLDPKDGEPEVPKLRVNPNLLSPDVRSYRPTLRDPARVAEPDPQDGDQ
ncbi:MAG: hypothetical protein ACOYOQ_00540 [Microthrixaceae bacterium]